jgi:type VI secretion system protein VasG
MNSSHNLIAEDRSNVSSDGNTMPELIGQRCTELERGARMVDALITNTMLPEISREFLTRLASGSTINRVHAGVKDGNFTFAFD